MCHVPRVTLKFKRYLWVIYKWFNHLKVPSGQIGSAWEWCHWKALQKDINRCMFLIFKFQYWAASCKIEPNLLLVRLVLSSYWLAHFHLKCSSILIRVAELMPLPHLWNSVWRKRLRLEHIQTVNRTSRRIRGLFAWIGSEVGSCISTEIKKK